MGTPIFSYGVVQWAYAEINIQLSRCPESSWGYQYSTVKMSGELMWSWIFHCGHEDLIESSPFRYGNIRWTQWTLGSSLTAQYCHVLVSGNQIWSSPVSRFAVKNLHVKISSFMRNRKGASFVVQYLIDNIKFYVFRGAQFTRNLKMLAELVQTTSKLSH